MASEIVSARENRVNPINSVRRAAQSGSNNSVEKIEVPKRAGREKEYTINGQNVRVSWSKNPSPFGSMNATLNVRINNGREQRYKFGWDYSKGYGDNAKYISSNEALSKAKKYIKNKTS